jgi:hypothetical protein
MQTLRYAFGGIVSGIVKNTNASADLRKRGNGRKP